MAVTKKEALQGIPDEIGPTAATTVGEIVAQIRAHDPALVLPNRIDEYTSVRIRNLSILPVAIESFLVEWIKAQQFCSSPPAEYAYLFHLAPDLDAMYPGSFRAEFGPVFFRGRLDGTARLLVVGQDPSSDEQLVSRAFVGFSGQRLQRFLNRVGLQRSYVIVNTFHWCVHGTYSTNPALRAATHHPDVVGWRNALLDRLVANNHIEAVLTIGTPAREAVRRHWPGHTAFLHPSRIVDIWHPSARSTRPLLASWNRGLDRLTTLVDPDTGATVDPARYGTEWTTADHTAIPRRDLPFGTPGWHGAGGRTRSRRDGNTVIGWTAP